jgi:hypothetical protein
VARRLERPVGFPARRKSLSRRISTAPRRRRDSRRTFLLPSTTLILIDKLTRALSWRECRAPASRRGGARCARASPVKPLESHELRSRMPAQTAHIPARSAEGELSPPPSITGFIPDWTSSYADPTPPAWRRSDAKDSRPTSAASGIRHAPTSAADAGTSDIDPDDELPPPVTLAADKLARGPRQGMPAREPDFGGGIDSAEAVRPIALVRAHRGTDAERINGGSAARRPSSASVDVSTPRILPGTYACLVSSRRALT